MQETPLTSFPRDFSTGSSSDSSLDDPFDQVCSSSCIDARVRALEVANLGTKGHMGLANGCEGAEDIANESYDILQNHIVELEKSVQHLSDAVNLVRLDGGMAAARLPACENSVDSNDTFNTRIAEALRIASLADQGMEHMASCGVAPGTWTTLNRHAPAFEPRLLAAQTSWDVTEDRSACEKAASCIPEESLNIACPVPVADPASSLQCSEDAAAEEARLAAEATAAEEARLAAGAKAAEEARLAAEAKVAEEARLAAEAKAAEEARLAAEAKAAEEARLAAEAKAAEEARLAAEAKAAEMARLAAEAKAAEEARLAAEATAADEARLAAEAKAAEEARLAAEVTSQDQHPCNGWSMNEPSLEWQQVAVHCMGTLDGASLNSIPSVGSLYPWLQVQDAALRIQALHRLAGGLNEYSCIPSIAMVIRRVAIVLMLPNPELVPNELVVELTNCILHIGVGTSDYKTLTRQLINLLRLWLPTHPALDMDRFKALEPDKKPKHRRTRQV